MSDTDENGRPYQPSGMKDETECPSDHIESDVVPVPCTSCGAQK